MPFGMFCYPEVVTLKESVYVGGGNSISGREDQMVMVYDISRDQWNILPQYQFCRFAMTTLNNQLLVIGGLDKQTNKRTNVVGNWDMSQQKWAHKFPPMHVARSGAAAVTHSDRWVVVTGGHGSKEAHVEILDSLEGHWYWANAPLPQQLYKMSSTTIDDVWYLLGGYSGREAVKTVVFIHLDKLVSQTVIQTSALSATPGHDRPVQWQVLPDTPLVGSTALAYNGLLLAIGGEKEIDKGSSAIHSYQPVTNCWIKTGNLLSERKECGCAVLPSGELFVVGGFIIPFMEQVDIGRVPNISKIRMYYSPTVTTK